jgi:hypothetical protein
MILYSVWVNLFSIKYHIVGKNIKIIIKQGKCTDVHALLANVI